MFDETGTERTVETVESSTEAMEQANLELTTETMGQEGLEQGRKTWSWSPRPGRPPTWRA